MYEKLNYASAEVHQEHLEAHLEQEVEEGLMLKMTDSEFEERFGENRAIAALAVLVEDDMGKKRVIHDGSHGIKVNHRIKRRDKVRMPSARRKRGRSSRSTTVVLSLVGDAEKAHRRIKYQEKEQGFLGCRSRSGGGFVYVNKVGTFGISSTPYWWTRLSASIIRLTHYLLGPDWLIDLLLYADDLEAMGPGRRGRAGAVLALWIDYTKYMMGLSEKRTEWVVNWISGIEEKRRVGWRGFAAALGRLGFASLCLPWERPFLGPLYAWSSAVTGQKGDLDVPWAVVFILKWMKKRLKEGDRMEEVPPRKGLVGEVLKIWTDAKATEEDAWIGGWLEISEDKKCRPWFSMKVDEVLAPWLKCRGQNPKRVIAALELLATLMAMRLWCQKEGTNARVFAQAFTDNKGNDFVLKKGMSTKFPLTMLVMEASDMMRKKNFIACLSWVRRDDNQGADDLTNENFQDFNMELRENVKSEDVKWLVLDDLLKEGKILYEEITQKKKIKKNSSVSKSPKEKGKFFNKWASQ